MSDQWTTESDRVADGTEQSVEDLTTPEGAEGAESTESTADVVADTAEAEAADPAEAHEIAAESDEATQADEVEEGAADVDAALVDPVKEFKDKLASQFGEWYVIHSYAGYENRVKANLENRMTSLNMEDYIFQAEVPHGRGHRDQERPEGSSSRAASGCPGTSWSGWTSPTSPGAP